MLWKNIGAFTPGSSSATGVTGTFTVIPGGLSGAETKNLYGQVIVNLQANDAVSFINTDNSTLQPQTHDTGLPPPYNIGNSASVAIEYLGTGM